MFDVELINVTKTFGKTRAVDGLALQVPKGSIYGFIGPNGSGKTTTLRMIMNIFYPDSGRIRVLGEERSEAWTDHIGYLPEERGLYKKMKLRALLRFLGRLKNARDVNAEVDGWLRKMDLTEWADRKVETLSKGMSQKAQFIAAVVSRPELIILDEPFTGLDPVNTNVLREAILELRAGGATVIFSTHDMNTAEKMCDYVFMIFKGRKVLDGTLSSIQDEYGSDTVRIAIDGDARLLADIPGVMHVTDFGRLQELRMQDGFDAQAVLAAIVARTAVRHFEIARPSLHDIFVRIAGGDGKENSHA